MIKRMLYFTILTSFMLLILLGANYTATKTSDEVNKLKKQISLFQNQLKDKDNTIKKLQKENQGFKKQIANFPNQIAKAKAMVAASQVRSVPQPSFFATQISLKQMIVDGKDYTPELDNNKFVCVIRYSGKELLSNNIYLPMDVVGQIFNKSYEWDTQNKILYFGQKPFSDNTIQLK